MEYLFDAVYTASVAIPKVPEGEGHPGRVWTQDGELHVRSDVEADDHASAAAAAIAKAAAAIEFRYGADRVPDGLELGDLRLRTVDFAQDHMPGLPNSWMTATDIARYTGRSLSQVMQSVITKPGFPEPIHSASGRSTRLWPVAETKAFLDDWLDQVGRRER
jgi:hypothetical protein